MSGLIVPEGDGKEPRLQQPKIAAQIRDVLTASGTRVRDQAKKIEQVLGVSNPTARRLLTGQGVWTDAEIDAVLDSVGYSWRGLNIVRGSYSSLQSQGLSSEVGQDSGDQQFAYECMISIDGVETPCIVYPQIPHALPPAASDSLCLSLAPGPDGQKIPTLVRSSGAANKTDLCAIDQIVIKPQYAKTGPLVAILDDDESFIEIVTRVLEMSGFRTESFNRGEALTTRARQQPPIDIFLMDWKLQGKTTLNEYLAELREASPDAVMAIVSGEIKADTAAESGTDNVFMEAAEKYDLTIFNKPLPGVVIVRTLMNEYKASKGHK